jgi:hypothetical protein
LCLYLIRRALLLEPIRYGNEELLMPPNADAIRLQVLAITGLFKGQKAGVPNVRNRMAAQPLIISSCNDRAMTKPSPPATTPDPACHMT